MRTPLRARTWTMTMPRCRSRLISLLILLGLLLAAGGCSSSRPRASGQTIRAMTYNIRHGEGMDGTIDIKRIAQLILREQADIVALQEVDRGVERTKKIDIMTTLSDLTGMTYTFGRTMEFQGGDYGNGLLTRFPILEERNVLYDVETGGERRGLMQLLLDVRGEEIVVMNTHLDHRESDSERVACVSQIRTAAGHYTLRPVIVLGDFNDHPESRAIAAMKEELTDAWEEAGRGPGHTYPADSPRKRIDYIFFSKPPSQHADARPTKLRALTARVVPSPASDHLPLLVEFESTPGDREKGP